MQFIVMSGVKRDAEITRVKKSERARERDSEGEGVR